MRIRRITRIRDYRVFRDMSWPEGLPAFGQFNLIYGWNGSGKTTLSNLFRHVQDQTPIPEGDVRFDIEGRSVDGADLGTAVLPQVHVFNSNAVRRSVFENPRDQLPPVYYLGEDSVEKRERIEELRREFSAAKEEQARHDERKRSAVADLEHFSTDRAREIKNLLTVSGGGPYNNYDAPKFKATADRLLLPDSAAKPLDKETRQQHLATKTGSPKPKVSKSNLGFPDLLKITRETKQVLSRTVFFKPLPELSADHVLESWVGKGLKLHLQAADPKTCRFCGQRLTAARLDELQGHFSDEFKALQEQIETLLVSAEDDRTHIADLRPPDSGLLYSHLRSAYGSAQHALDEATAAAGQYLDALESALQEKKSAPFKAIALLAFFEKDQSAAVLKLLRYHLNVLAKLDNEEPSDPGHVAWQAIQATLDEHNRHTDEFTRELAEVRRALEEDQVLSVLGELKKKRLAVETEAKKTERANERATSVQAKITQLELDLREHRRPAEELNREIASYLGYNDLTIAAEESGYSITRNGKPAMNLSESERTAIAFMYYLKSLNDTSFDFKNGIAVIDDPISSLDANSLFSAFGYMKERTAGIGQLFVLTHNFSFFRQVRTWFHHMPNQGKKDVDLRPARFFMLDCRYRNGTRCAALKPLDPLLEKYQTEYHFLFSQLFEAAFGPETDEALEASYGKPNMARRLLEAFLAFRLPSLAGRLSQQFEELPFEPATKARVLRFLHTYSHHGQIAEPEHDVSILSETRAILRDVFALIEHVDLEHYKGMIEVIGAGEDSSLTMEEK